MKLKVLFCALVAIALSSCNNDPEGNSLNGTWRLTNATAPEGLALEYTPGEVQWTFDEDSHRLSVTNNVYTDGPENIFSGLSTGVYSYTIRKVSGKNMLYVNESPQGAIANTSSNLIINYDSDNDNEGLTKVFRR